MVDHPYSVVLKDGSVAWVIEPYEAGPEDLAELRRLVGPVGWKITVHPERALHFPGNTVAVWITRA